MQHKVDTQEVKERHFTQMALRFAMVGSDFHQYRQQDKLREQLPELAQQLNTIRGILAQLHALPLTSTEHEGVTKLKEEEVRFRTALYVFVESGARHPAPETAAKAAGSWAGCLAPHQIGRTQVLTPVTATSRIPAFSLKKKKKTRSAPEHYNTAGPRPRPP